MVIRVAVRSHVRIALLPVVFLISALMPVPRAWAKGTDPVLRLTLESLGVPTQAGASLKAAGALTTVHFVDEQHLLLTFNVRRLLKRLPECPPDDDDRTIRAIVVALPEGKVVAETEWRVHDTRQYLWDLGHGRFVLRVRDTMTTFAPLVNLAAGQPFAEQPFLQAERRVVALLLSPDRDLVTVETVAHPALKGKEQKDDPPAAPVKPGTQINFYRLVQPTEPSAKMIVQTAGVAVARTAVDLSLTSAGYIEVLPETATRWLFDLDTYDGRFVELSPFDTSCRPRPVFVSASEFVAFGCLRTTDKVSLGGFNLRGEQMWQQNFPDAQAYPNFSFAPEGGRFALSRNIVAPGMGMTVDFAPESFTTQEIRVYQAYSGRQLLRVEVQPVQAIGQNYDLSPGGQALAVLRQGSVELYRLPEMTAAEVVEMRASRAMAPADARLMVNLSPHPKKVEVAEKKGGKKEVVAVETAKGLVAPGASVAPVAAAPPYTPGTVVGDVQDSGGAEPRKAPTIYTLPTDKPPK